MEAKPVSLTLLNVVLEYMRIVKADFAAGAGGSSVSPSQYRILRRLKDGEATVSELARWNAVTLPTATKILDVLVERDWVERWRSRTDRRLVLVGLTQKGREVQVELEQRAAGSIDAVLQRVDPAVLGTVEEAVAGIAAALAQREQEEGSSTDDQEGTTDGN